MNRHSSNRVKMLKMAASATKHTTKLTASERKSVASIRFGKPRAEKPRCVFSCGDDTGSAVFDFKARIAPDEMNGTRRTSKNSKLKANMKTVAIQGPT